MIKTAIILKEKIACKCSCREQIGSDNKKYWYDFRKGEVYSTDCHENNPIKAKGTFIVGKKTIVQ